MNKLLKNSSLFRRSMLIATIYCLFLSASAFADDEATQHASHANLAQASQNPIAHLISVPFENDTNFKLGDFDRTQNILSVKPVYPLKLNGGWSLITRVIAPLFLPQPIVNQPDGQKSGLGDINPQFSFVAPPMGKMMIGAGPQFIVPTATDPSMGSEKWSAGPTAVIVFLPHKIVTGALISQARSFAGRSDRPNVSSLAVQPFYNCNFDKGWFFYSNPVITANWKATSGNKWTVPLGGGFGRVFQVGNQHMKFQAGAFGNIVRPDNGAEWQAQAALSLLYPK